MSAELNNCFEIFLDLAHKTNFTVYEEYNSNKLIGIRDDIIIELEKDTSRWYICIKKGFILNNRHYIVIGQINLCANTTSEDIEKEIKEIEEVFQSEIEKEWKDEIEENKIKRLMKEAIKESKGKDYYGLKIE